MDKTTDTVKNCPAHLEPALATARIRWACHRIGDHRATQAGEVLQFAADILSSRSWDEARNGASADDHAALGAWLARTAIVEESVRIAAASAAPKAADLGTLTAAEIALVLAARKAAQ